MISKNGGVVEEHFGKLDYWFWCSSPCHLYLSLDFQFCSCLMLMIIGVIIINRDVDKRQRDIW